MSEMPTKKMILYGGGVVVVVGPFVFVLSLMTTLIAGGYFTVLTTPPKTEPLKEFTRTEFEKTVLGKTPQEVIALAGRPSQTWRGESKSDDIELPSFDGTFVYYRINSALYVVDPVSGNPDLSVRLEFKNGTVKRVIY